MAGNLYLIDVDAIKLIAAAISAGEIMATVAAACGEKKAASTAREILADAEKAMRNLQFYKEA